MKKRLIAIGMAILLLLLVLPAVAGCVGGEEKYPSKPIDWIIPYGAGGGFDTYARQVGTEMMKYLPQEAPIVFKNVTGAGGVIAITQIYNSEPDGYTIGMMNLPGHAVNQYFGDVQYDLEKCSYIGTLNADDFAEQSEEEYSNMNKTSGAGSVQSSKEVQNLSQANKVKDLQQGMSRMLYVDKEGRTQNFASQVRNVQGRGIYQRGEEWIDLYVQDNKSRKTNRIQFASKEYFELLDNEPQTSQFLSLGKNVRFVYKDDMYEIYE